MKIAVVLRGQARCAKLGSELFQRFVVDENPQHEFDVFIHTTNTETICDARDLSLRPLNVYDVELQDLDYIHENYLNYWKPKKYIIEGTNKFLNTIDNIINENKKDTKLNNILNIESHVPNLLSGINNYQVKLHALHFMSQHWGAARGYSLIDSDYDLILQTRPDCLFYFEKDMIQRANDILEYTASNHLKGISTQVMSHILSVRFSKPFVSDYLYVHKQNIISQWFLDVEKTFFDLFTKDKLDLYDLIGDDQTKFQNLLFLKFGKKLEFINNHNCWKAEIVRPGVEINQTDDVGTVFDKCRVKQQNFRKDRNSVEVDLEPIYEKLLNNDLWLEGSYE